MCDRGRFCINMHNPINGGLACDGIPCISRCHSGLLSHPGSGGLSSAGDSLEQNAKVTSKRLGLRGFPSPNPRANHPGGRVADDLLMGESLGLLVFANGDASESEETRASVFDPRMSFR